MICLVRRRLFFVLIAVIATLVFLHILTQPNANDDTLRYERLIRPGIFGKKFRWRDVPQRHPVQNLTPLPNGPLVDIPKIQADFPAETQEEKIVRERRLKAVQDAFLHSWEGYKKNSWLQDEVAPLTGSSKNEFGGWGATLVDSLDTLWIMGLTKEFSHAVEGIKHIDFTRNPLSEVNVFETTIRYLGGLLGAYDISGQRYPCLLRKAVELGDMLYVAFDTPNRMPVTRWDWKNGMIGGDQEAGKFSLSAEVGSMTLEFTRLSQLTGESKWYDAVARVTDTFQDWQNYTKLPGLWPILIDTNSVNYKRDTTFTLGGMSDSLYEYFPKEHLLLGGRTHQYQSMYKTALETLKTHLFFTPLNPHNDKLLMSGTMKRTSPSHLKLIPELQHLTCFSGGMVALAAKIFRQTHDIKTAQQLLNGCLWAYESTASGIMPETFRAVPCDPEAGDNCTWTEQKWVDAVAAHVNYGAAPENKVDGQHVIAQRNLPPGMVDVRDPSYSLRPEAIESLFVVYRITGDKKLQEKAWKMFQTISKLARTDIAFASIRDVRDQKPQLYDSMQSFWTAETLKYFYLIFSEPDVVSLDEYVLNTEAHPLLRPR